MGANYLLSVDLLASTEWLFWIELFSYQFLQLRVNRGLLTNMNWKHRELSESLHLQHRKKRTGWGTKHNLYVLVLDCVSLTSFWRRLYSNMQLQVGWHGWQLKVSKLCWLQKIYIYLHPCDRKGGEGAEDTKGLNETKTVVEG